MFTIPNSYVHTLTYANTHTHTHTHTLAHETQCPVNNNIKKLTPAYDLCPWWCTTDFLTTCVTAPLSFVSETVSSYRCLTYCIAGYWSRVLIIIVNFMVYSRIMKSCTHENQLQCACVLLYALCTRHGQPRGNHCWWEGRSRSERESTNGVRAANWCFNSPIAWPFLPCLSSCTRSWLVTNLSTHKNYAPCGSRKITH